MKIIQCLIFLLIAHPVFAGEWWHMNHAMNEVMGLNCRILKKKIGTQRWSRVGQISDYHSGKNDRNFKYDRRLDDGYFTDRYLHVSFQLNSWDYEIENFDTGEWNSYRYQGVTHINFKIEDRHMFSTTVLSSQNVSVRDLAKLQLIINDPSTSTEYRFNCDERI